MSLVGPRPDHDFQLQRYEKGDCRKLAMRPGITSLAQVSGRNALSWRERTDLEIEYVECFSLGLDMQIAWRTVGVVVRGTGLNNPSRSANDDGGT
jgi:lipopolysaccharide/colanic/teichoic acid biosynthesis glycosyltransferase